MATGTGAVDVPVAELVTPAIRERARTEANHWIKRLRLVQVAGRSLRDALGFRGESMWWFVELYLHRQGRITALFEAVLAIEALLDRKRPSSLKVVSDDAAWHVGACAVARARGLRLETPRRHDEGRWRVRLRLELRSLWYVITALLSRLRPSRPGETFRTDIAVFVHSAFVRPAGAGDRLAAHYLGDVITALESADDAGPVGFVGLGPRRNFHARRWWDALTVARPTATEVVSIERYAPLRALSPSLRYWWARREHVRFLTDAAIRRAALVAGHDLWPVVEEQLLGAALLQLPWSARARDEAGAALDSLRPRVVVTYAEAGGWGRALLLEARRRGVPSVGLQHGFIYRHWLNYLHEPDEMAPSAGHPDDRGFPVPDRTLVFDGYAKRHLVEHGRFPADAIVIAGSPTFETLRDEMQQVDADRRAAVRARLGAGPDQPLAIVVSKHAQIAPALPALAAAAARTGSLLVVLPHPGEAAGDYDAVADPSSVVVAGEDLRLPVALAVAEGIVTVNSTVAVDALALGVPALVVLLPTNLSPFVDQGAMLGASRNEEIAPALDCLLRDEATRRALGDAAADLVERYGFGAASGASSRAARAILEARV